MKQLFLLNTEKVYLTYDRFRNCCNLNKRYIYSVANKDFLVVRSKWVESVKEGGVV